MATTASLLELRLRVRRRADMESSTFVVDDKDEVDFYINSAIAKLHTEIGKFDEGSYFAKTATIATFDGDDTYQLPTDFGRMLRVLVETPGGAYAEIERFSLKSIGRRRAERGWQVGSGYANAKYRVIAGSIMFIPAASASHTVELWYVPQPPRLVVSSDTWSAQNDDWINFVVADAAIPLLLKEESDTRAVKSEANQALGRLIEAAFPRDQNEADYVEDIYSTLSDLPAEWRHP